MTKDDFVSLMDYLYRPTRKLMQMAPEGKEDWKPTEDSSSLGWLLHHLGCTTSIVVRGLLTGDYESMTNPHVKNKTSLTPAEAQQALDFDQNETKELLAGLSEEDFQNRRVETPWGDKGRFEMVLITSVYSHLENHKMQLFMYLKQLGITVDTGTLYYGADPGMFAAPE